MNQVKELFEYIFNAIKIWIIVQPWQQGLRVRNGKSIKLLNGGIYFRIPYFDSIFVQEIRLRTILLPIQTLTSKDLKTITISSCIGYSITSLEQLYKTLHHPETTLQNIAMSQISEFIFKNNLNDITPEIIENNIISKLNNENYGIKFEYFKITSFAVVRTYRLIQDNGYVYEGLSMDNKK